MADSKNILLLARQSRLKGDFSNAQHLLEMLIESEPDNHLAWREKYLVPILQEDNVSINSCSVSFSKYQHLSPEEKRAYLLQCGFEVSELPKVTRQLILTNLIDEQRTKYLKIALCYAPESEKYLYEAELKLNARASSRRSRKLRQTAIIAGFVTLLISFLIMLRMNLLFGSPFSQILSILIILLISFHVLTLIGVNLHKQIKKQESRALFGIL